MNDRPMKYVSGFSLCLAFLFAVVLAAFAEQRVEEKDTNGDGKIDEWRTYDGKVPIRMERDLDGDGKKELVVFFEKGKPARSEMDRNKDGKIDFLRLMKDGKPEKECADTNFDGKWDVWSYYKDGFKDLMMADKNYDGKPDAWFYYSLGGTKLTGGRIDTDFDGKIDRSFGPAPEKEDRQPFEPPPFSEEKAGAAESKGKAK